MLSSSRPLGQGVTCGNCVVRKLCLPHGLTDSEIATVEGLVSTRVRVRRGAALYRTGDPFKSLYVVWLGCMKSTLCAHDSAQQVTGFHMAGETVGLDGMATGSHASDLVALEDSEVCVLPYSRVGEALDEVPALRQHFHAMMSREIVRKHEMMLLLGSMPAEERLARFLLDLSESFERRGYSSREFTLRMSRADIGSLLGLTLETVCRLLSQFSKDGLIALRGPKSVMIEDMGRLRELGCGGRPRRRTPSENRTPARAQPTAAAPHHPAPPPAGALRLPAR